ncbi:MAG: sulfotransferase family 2 domain-containing protein [Flavobacteriales bacterium]|jgi:hypothetical protein|nr:sulfotransferase family 2 domain-containing protein [Flavobacteriales bacterium]
MSNFIRNIIKNIKRNNFAKKQRSKVLKDGNLLNAFNNKKIIFIHMPKTAGISLVKSIFGDVTLEGHRSVSFYKQVFGSRYSDFFTFTIVRNPWDRLYSAYKFLEKGGMNIHDKNAFETHLSIYRDFEDFVLNGLNKKITLEIMHLIPQHEFVCDKNGKIIVDHIGRFENLNKSIEKINDILKSDFKLEHHNKTDKKNYKDIYTTKMIEKVHQIYQKDIDIFEYKFS